MIKLLVTGAIMFILAGCMGANPVKEQTPEIEHSVMTQEELSEYAKYYYSAGIQETLKQLIEGCAGVDDVRLSIVSEGLQYDILCRSAQF